MSRTRRFTPHHETTPSPAGLAPSKSALIQGGAKSRLKGQYNTPEPNAKVVLYRGRVRVTQGSTTEEGDGIVEVRWYPQPKIFFAIPSLVWSLSFEDCTLELVERRGWRCAATVEARGSGGIRGRVDRVAGGAANFEPGMGPRVTELRAHLPNFLNIGGARLARDGGDGDYCGRIEFDVEPWRVTLDSIEGKATEVLKTTGGFVFTHILSCRRVDGADFDPMDLKELLFDLDTVLSFCAGHWVGVSLATGHEAGGALVWENWRLPWLAPYEEGRTWFPNYYSEGVLEAVVPAFVKASCDPVVGRVLRTAVHWHVQANGSHSSIDGSIVVALTALELLAWNELVTRGTMTPEAFEKEGAHGKIRRYLAAKSIPCASVPSELADLAAFVAAEQGCSDGVEGLTRIRNRTVHPPKASGFKDFSFEVLEQAWRYVLYLLERSILAEIGYHGHINERLGWQDLVI